jgi:hypothetical protein
MLPKSANTCRENEEFKMKKQTICSRQGSKSSSAAAISLEPMAPAPGLGEQGSGTKRS